MAKIRGVYKRGAYYWIRYVGHDGKMRFESSKSKSYKDAYNLLAIRKNDVMDGKDPLLYKKMKKVLFYDFCVEYLEWAESQKSDRSKKGISKMLKEHFGNIPLSSFSTMIVEKYQIKLLNDGKAPSTTNRRLACLKHMFTKAIEWEMASEEVLKKVRRVKLLKENNRRLRFLSKEECTELIENCAPHLKPIVITALNTGMRKNEILSLKWEENIDLRHGFILLSNTKNGDRREIPINNRLREVLTFIVRRIDSPYVFIDKNGSRYNNIRRSFLSACRRTGIKDFRFHDLRHTFASQLVMAGVDITTVKELLGHKTLTMTLRYAHLAPAHKVKAVEMLDKPDFEKIG